MQGSKKQPEKNPVYLGTVPRGWPRPPSLRCSVCVSPRRGALNGHIHPPGYSPSGRCGRIGDRSFTPGNKRVRPPHEGPPSLFPLGRCGRVAASFSAKTYRRVRPSHGGPNSPSRLAAEMIKPLPTNQNVWEGRFITFDRCPPAPKSVTSTWLVQAKRDGAVLGEVRWFRNWRKYCFFPATDCVFEEDCLTDIAAFIIWATEAHTSGV